MVRGASVLGMFPNPLAVLDDKLGNNFTDKVVVQPLGSKISCSSGTHTPMTLKPICTYAPANKNVILDCEVHLQAPKQSSLTGKAVDKSGSG
jgi:hypothetical protein